MITVIGCERLPGIPAMIHRLLVDIDNGPLGIMQCDRLGGHLKEYLKLLEVVGVSVPGIAHEYGLVWYGL